MSTTPTSASTEARARRQGVLLANLGTPQSPSTADVRAYLAQFLSDPKVVRTNRIVWWFVLRGIILPFRAPKSARLYRSVWTAQGSPLLYHTRAQAAGLAQRLGPAVPVAVGMRYGRPSLAEAVAELVEQGCEELLLLPMFPQESETTTGSLLEEAGLEIARRSGLASRSIAPFHSHPAYIAALARNVRETPGSASAGHRVICFHGLPVAYVEAGDRYLEHCRATASLLAESLGWREADWSLAFQSRFGPQRWLEPALEDRLADLATAHKRVLVTTPGFVADCLETLEEVKLRAREHFLRAGGEELVLVPCLNDRPDFLDALSELVRAELHPSGNAGGSGSGGRT